MYMEYMKLVFGSIYTLKCTFCTPLEDIDENGEVANFDSHPLPLSSPLLDLVKCLPSSSPPISCNRLRLQRTGWREKEVQSWPCLCSS